MLGIGALFLAEQFEAGILLQCCLGTGREGVCTRGGFPFWCWYHDLNQVHWGKVKLWGYRQGNLESSAEGRFLPKPCCGGPILLCVVPLKTRISNIESNSCVLFLWPAPPECDMAQLKVQGVLGGVQGRQEDRARGNEVGTGWHEWHSMSLLSSHKAEGEVHGSVALFLNTQVQLLWILGRFAVTLPE